MKFDGFIEERGGEVICRGCRDIANFLFVFIDWKRVEQAYRLKE